MSRPRIHFSLISSLCLAMGMTANLQAQILNSAQPATDEGVQQAAESPSGKAKKSSILPASWSGIAMPKITMPKVSMPKIAFPKWPTDDQGKALSPLAPISAGAEKISSGTKQAWAGTKELFSFGSKKDDTQTSIASAQQTKPSFWQRMLAPAPEPDGPQTVGEWMSQPRLDP